MFKFSIKEESENPLECIIEKSGITTTFTLQQLKEHQEYVHKIIKETKAQLEIHKQQDILSIEILPILKEIPDDKWNLVMAYASRQVQKPESEALLETSEKTLGSYQEQLKDIHEQTGLYLAVLSPFMEEEVIPTEVPVEEVAETPVEETTEDVAETPSEETNG